MPLMASVFQQVCVHSVTTARLSASEAVAMGKPLRCKYPFQLSILSSKGDLGSSAAPLCPKPRRSLIGLYGQGAGFLDLCLADASELDSGHVPATLSLGSEPCLLTGDVEFNCLIMGASRS